MVVFYLSQSQNNKTTHIIYNFTEVEFIVNKLINTRMSILLDVILLFSTVFFLILSGGSNVLAFDRLQECSTAFSQKWQACKEFDPASPDDTNQTCMNAVVPGTVLSTLLENGIFNFTDPYFEDNLSLIPDIWVIGSEYYTYWFVLRFNAGNLIDCLDAQRSRLHLSFRGINYRSSIYLNGNQLSDSSTSSGMFLSKEMDITEYFKSENILAVQVLPPDFVGEPNVGQGGDHQIARNGAIMQVRLFFLYISYQNLNPSPLL